MFIVRTELSTSRTFYVIRLKNMLLFFVLKFITNTGKFSNFRLKIKECKKYV